MGIAPVEVQVLSAAKKPELVCRLFPVFILCLQIDYKTKKVFKSQSLM